jgi:hypothetical protein
MFQRECTVQREEGREHAWAARGASIADWRLLRANAIIMHLGTFVTEIHCEGSSPLCASRIFF